MEVPGARRAVSEEDEDRLLLAPQFHGPSDADRMGQLRADRGRDREIVPLPVDVMARHLMPFDGIFRVPYQLAEKFLQRHAADDGRTRFAILRDDPILRTHRHRHADDRALLAYRGTVESDSNFALQGEH